MLNSLVRVGVIRGGSDLGAEVSVNSGSAIIQSINEHLSHKYRPHDVFIDRRGNWYIDGRRITIVDLHSKIDIAFNALHGNLGEDGKIQSLLEWHGIPFTGSGSVSSAVTFNKILSKNLFDSHEIKNPYGVAVDSLEIKNNLAGVMGELFRSFILPAIVKPADSGSSIGVSVAHYYDQLEEALLKASNHSQTVIIEEYIKGIEATCGVIENFRSKEIYALPPVEIKTDGLFDYYSKYVSGGQEVVPASFSAEIKKEIERLSIQIHQLLGLRHYSRSDFVIHPKRGIFVLEVNTAPGLTKESSFLKSLRSVGSDLHHFIEHVVEMVKN